MSNLLYLPVTNKKSRQLKSHKTHLILEEKKKQNFFGFLFDLKAKPKWLLLHHVNADFWRTKNRVYHIGRKISAWTWRWLNGCRRQNDRSCLYKPWVRGNVFKVERVSLKIYNIWTHFEGFHLGTASNSKLFCCFFKYF